MSTEDLTILETAKKAYALGLEFCERGFAMDPPDDRPWTNDDGAALLRYLSARLAALAERVHGEPYEVTTTYESNEVSVVVSPKAGLVAGQRFVLRWKPKPVETPGDPTAQEWARLEMEARLYTLVTLDVLRMLIRYARWRTPALTSKILDQLDWFDAATRGVCPPGPSRYAPEMFTCRPPRRFYETTPAA